MTFKNSNDSALFGAAADAEWAAFRSPTNGFLQVTIGNSTAQLGVSAFHAIHCLNAMRQIMEVYFDVASPQARNAVHGSEGDFFHLHHCLIYLRQMLICSADPALENEIFKPNGSSTAFGDGTTHTCRNFDELKNMLHW